MRVLVVWCPDWSVVAALREAERPASEPAAVLAAGVVEVCNAQAREEGVRRGQRRRDAQARCPELVVLDANPDRDARHFEPVLETVEQLRPGVAPLRPGLLAVRAPGRWFGGEANAAAVLAETLVEAGVWDCRLGVADDLFTAEQAARRAGVQECEVVPAGGSASYLRDLPVEVLEADGAEGREAVSLLRRLGLRTLGDVAALPLDAVQDRFGRYGAQVWRRARGEAPTRMAPRTPPPDLEAQVSFEPALDSVEAVCFSVRTTAERLVAELAARQLVATGVRIEAEHDGAVASARTWLHPRYFSVRDLVDRVHWQLQGSTALRSRQESGRVRAPVERVRFVPEVVEPAAAHSEGLWGGAGEELVERGVARVQAMVGFDSVTRPVLQGGRGPADRQGAVPWGERATALRPVDRPWPGQLPGPPPCRVFTEPLAAEVRDGTGRQVAVTDRGVVTGVPTRFFLGEVLGEGWQPVAAWAGPWPLDETWWAGEGGRVSRFQVVGADGRAWLLTCGPDGWRVEAGYD
jgi:protein ImuB